MEQMSRKIGDCEVRILPVIRGLTSEGDRVRRAILDFRPATLALSISPEELSALRSHDGEPLEPLCGTVEENVYESGLGRFGEVERPPRCFTSAVNASGDVGAKVVGVDLTEEEFTRSYVALVSGWDYVRRALGKGSFERAKFDFSSPEAFVLDWDGRLRRVKGFDMLEKRREARIARGIEELAPRASRLMAIVELERAEGVVSQLDKPPEGQ
jgi:hypothetical protein